jgi:hypothetical protein
MTDHELSITVEEFEKRFGRKPMHDDLDRVNCSNVGSVGHWFCGVCRVHKKPRFECGCPEKMPQGAKL